LSFDFENELTHLYRYSDLAGTTLIAHSVQVYTGHGQLKTLTTNTAGSAYSQFCDSPGLSDTGGDQIMVSQGASNNGRIGLGRAAAVAEVYGQFNKRFLTPVLSDWPLY
jgi:hypothetical protein